MAAMTGKHRWWHAFIDKERASECEEDFLPAIRVSDTVARLLQMGMQQQGGVSAVQLPDGRYECTFVLAPKGWPGHRPKEDA